MIKETKRSFLLTILFRFPYDWRNPFGYFVATMQVYIIFTFMLFFISVIISLGIGCYLFGITTANEIKSVFIIANKKLRLKSEHSLALKRFTELVELHSMAKQLSKLKTSCQKNAATINHKLSFSRLITNFSGYFQSIFMINFLWSLVTMCITMLMVQMAIV